MLGKYKESSKRCWRGDGSEVFPICGSERWSASVCLIGFARPHGVVGPGFPAGILVAWFNVLPQTFTFEFNFGAQYAVDSPGASWTVSEDFGNLIFEEVFGGVRDCVFDFL